MSDEMDEIWALYADDGAQALDAAEDALLALQGGGSQDEIDAHVAALFRAVHTFKGNSRVLGLAVVESRAHVAEDLIGLVRDDGVPLDEDILDVLLLAGDTLRTMLEETASTRADVDPGPSEDLQARLKATIARCKGEEAPAAAEADAKADEPPAEAAEAAEEPAAPAAKPAGGGLGGDAMAALAMLADASDDDEGSDAFDSEDDFWDAMEEAEAQRAEEAEAEEAAAAAEPEPAPAAAPAAEAAPAPAPAPKKDDKQLAEVVEQDDKAAASRMDDPAYRDIFLNMVDDTLKVLTGFVTSPVDDPAAAFKKARKKADNLAYAAEQMGLGEWADALYDYEKEAKGVDDSNGDAVVESIAQAVECIKKCQASTFGGEAEAEEEAAEIDMPQLFVDLQNIFGEVSNTGMQFGADEPPTPEALVALAEKLLNIVEPYGCVRVAEAAKLMGRAQDAETFRQAELKFYEELTAIEGVMPEGSVDVEVRPSALLAVWCAEHIFETLSQLRDVLEAIRKQDNRNRQFRRFDRLMRLAYHACRNYHLDTAAQLTMALIDLFSRVELGGSEPDGLLTHIARGFVDTMELVFDALDQGDQPDTEMIEKLFEEASNACFHSDGLVTARTIEKRLGLPESFHRVLSPESVKTALIAIEDHLRFYVVRADLNEDEQLAQSFLEWISTGNVRMITNVTVFEGDKTIFDFLLAVQLDPPGVSEQLANLDPEGVNLKLMTVLETKDQQEDEAQDEEPAEKADAGGFSISMKQTLSLLETIGEISAGQSMVQHMLDELCNDDLLHDIDTGLRDNNASPIEGVTRRVIRDTIDKFAQRLQQTAEAEAQLSEQLAILQEESVAIRSRPIAALLKPLAAFVETEARKLKAEARLSTGGEALTLDQQVMEELRTFLKILFVERLNGTETRPTQFHISVDREEDRVTVLLDDNGSHYKKNAKIDEIADDLKKRKGEFRAVNLPNGGVRFHIALPLQMIVLDGMVVRVRDVRYVVPIDSILRIHQGDTASILNISASKGRKMLRISKEEHVPIRSLSGSLNAANDDAPGSPEDKKIYVIVRNAEQQLAIPVDELLGQQLVLLRPLRGVLSRANDLTGVALLAGGEVGMVLSVSRLRAA